MLNEKNKPFPKRYFLSYLWTWYIDIFFWLLIGVGFYRLWGNRRFWLAGCLVVEFRANSWPRRTWFKRWLGASLMHTLLISDGRVGNPEIVDTRTERHELTHSRQAEVLQLLAAILFSYVALSTEFQWQYLLILPSGAALAYLASLIQAFLRGETPYYNSIFEDHAYATDSL